MHSMTCSATTRLTLETRQTLQLLL